MDCAVRARPLWTLTPTTSAAWELPAFLAASPRLASRPTTDRRPALVLGCGEGGWAGQPLVA